MDDDMYQQNILDHYKHPRHKGALSSYDVKEEGSNPSCGDELTLYLSYNGDVVRDVGFEGEGCAISVAGMSLLSEKVIGMKKADIAKLTQQDVYDLLGVAVGPQREKCALLSLRTLQSGIKDRS